MARDQVGFAEFDGKALGSSLNLIQEVGGWVESGRGRKNAT